jgi:DNA-binding Lrp family transcriptional regulator
VVGSILTDPNKTYNAVANETGLSNKTVKRRLERMLQGHALFMMPSLDPRFLRGATLGELLVFYESPEAKKKENDRIRSHIDALLMSAQLGDPEHMLFQLAITNISQVKEILSWVKDQPAVKSAYLDLVEERVEQYEVFNQQLERKLKQVRSAGRKVLQPTELRES